MTRDSGYARRDFVTALAGGLWAVLALPGLEEHRCGHGAAGGPHPEPRVDADGSEVLTAEELDGYSQVVPIYDGIREIPQVADGIRCYCGCADLPDYRSLLTCYEGGGMAMMCQICQTEGRMVVRLARAGRTLDQIRAAVEARFG